MGADRRCWHDITLQDVQRWKLDSSSFILPFCCPLLYLPSHSPLPPPVSSSSFSYSPSSYSPLAPLPLTPFLSLIRFSFLFLCFHSLSFYHILNQLATHTHSHMLCVPTCKFIRPTHTPIFLWSINRLISLSPSLSLSPFLSLSLPFPLSLLHSLSLTLASVLTCCQYSSWKTNSPLFIFLQIKYCCHSK